MLPTIKRISPYILFYFFLSSCLPLKKVPYFQDLPRGKDTSEVISNYTPLVIQKNDKLNIYVSSLNAEASALFNPPVQPAGGSSPSNAGMLVDEQGNIRLPYLDTIHVAGLSIPQARDTLTLKLQKYLKEPQVRLSIENFKIGVFGAVQRPGIYPVSGERITLPEALIMANDLQLEGRRNDVLVVREIDGKRKFIRFNLNSRSTFSSPDFYLKNNDLVYVEPNVSRERRSRIFEHIGLITPLVTIILILIRL